MIDEKSQQEADFRFGWSAANNGLLYGMMLTDAERAGWNAYKFGRDRNVEVAIKNLIENSNVSLNVR